MGTGNRKNQIALRVRSFALFLALLISPAALQVVDQSSAYGGPYIEAGTSLGTIQSGDQYFQKPGSKTGVSSFVGSLSLYFTLPPFLNFTHFDVGLQNRFSIGSSSSTPANSLAMITPNLAVRYEFWRFFAGAGFAPITFGSANGISSVRIRSDTYSYFLEGGLIWRVVPEFQIALAVGIERGVVRAQGASPTVGEYGLRFRFPINPKDDAVGKRVKFDGFRYPFGVMKD